MLKNIISAWFGTTGKVVMTVLTLFLFYLSPAVSLKSTDGDTQGWGLLFYLFLFLPAYVIAMAVFAIFSLKSAGIKTLATGLVSYVVIAAVFWFCFERFNLKLDNLYFAIAFLVVHLAYLVLLYHLAGSTIPKPVI